MVDIIAGDQNTPHSKSKKLKKMSWKKWLAILVVLALVIGGIWVAYDYSQLKKENDKLSNPTKAAKAATSQLVAEVGALTNLPTGETPTVATVSDASKLKNQAFFANAQNGDKVLIYTQAKRAILYRPSTGKIIEIAPINLGSSNQNSNSSDSNSSESNN